MRACERCAMCRVRSGLERRVDRRMYGLRGYGRALTLTIDLCSQLIKLLVQRTNLVLQHVQMVRHVLELLRVLEASAAVGRIYAFEVEVAASLARSLPIALYLAALAFITIPIVNESSSPQLLRMRGSPSNRDIAIPPSPLLAGLVFGFSLGAIGAVVVILVVVLQMLRHLGNGLRVHRHGRRGQQSRFLSHGR